ncbi:MAG: M13 family metallopeptidase [Acidobacteria bacterium]|nr:M13 family metallopeptidase [Acidobacteriota bacterium]
MSRLFAPVALVTALVLPAPTLAQAPAAAPRPTATPAPAPDRPLQQLPYSPSLDLTSLDREVDPCADFYAFACGGWQERNPIPPDQSSWSVYRKLYQENLRFLWGLLEEAGRPAGKRSADQQRIGDYFAACIDTAAVDRLGAKPIEPALREIAALRDKKALAAFVGRQHLAMDSGALLFGFGSEQDAADSTQVIAGLYAGGLGLPDRDYYLKDDERSRELRDKYAAFAKEIFRLLGDEDGVAAANAATVLAIETELARASLTRVEKRDPHAVYHKMTSAELARLGPSFDWPAYFKAAGIGRVPSLNVSEPEFVRGLERQLRERSLGEWKTYLRWHIARARAEYLSRPFAEAHFAFYGKALRGLEQSPPRWKECVEWVDRDLGEALGKVFVEKTFSPEIKKRALDVTRRVQQAMEQDIKELPWMGEKTKQQALAKLHSMVNKIGYPDRWRDYSALTIKRDDFAGNVTRSLVFESRRQLAKIGKPVDRGEWGMTPPTVNAYYNPQMNDMNFPAGVLQPPLFDPKMDDAPNYGNTGATIGHELTHGFDDEGRQFDARGNLRDWWTAEDAAEFQERAQCVIDQYARYVIVDDIHINSRLTTGEDIADLGGTLLAYRAWRAATANQRLAPIDGFTPDQRFFIGMAQWACSNMRPEEERLRAVTDPHSPTRYRVNGVVANMPEFKDAFSCREGQPMVRSTPCRVW